MEPKWIRAFVYSAGGVLLAAALGRFIIALGSAPVLDLPDPLLEIPLRYAVLGVGVLELAVALVCLFAKSLGRQAGLVGWLATNWAVYRVASVSVQPSKKPHGGRLGTQRPPLGDRAEERRGRDGSQSVSRA